MVAVCGSDIFCSSQEALSWHFSNFTTLIHHFLILWPNLCLVLLVVSHRLWTACLLTGQCLLQSWCSSGSDPLMTYDMQSKRVKCPGNVDIAHLICTRFSHPTQTHPNIVISEHVVTQGSYLMLVGYTSNGRAQPPIGRAPAPVYPSLAALLVENSTLIMQLDACHNFHKLLFA